MLFGHGLFVVVKGFDAIESKSLGLQKAGRRAVFFFYLTIGICYLIDLEHEIANEFVSIHVPGRE